MKLNETQSKPERAPASSFQVLSMLKERDWFVKKKDVSVCFYSKLYKKNIRAFIRKSYPLLGKEKMTESS
jgi:hypothetical protein